MTNDELVRQLERERRIGMPRWNIRPQHHNEPTPPDPRAAQHLAELTRPALRRAS